MERAGRPLARVNQVFGVLTGAHTNDALLEIEREISPREARHWNGILLNEPLFTRIDDSLPAPRPARPQCRAGARAGTLSPDVHARGRCARCRREKATRRDQRAAGDARHHVQPERAGRRAELHARRSTARTISPACPISCWPLRALPPTERGMDGQACHHAVALERRAVPAVLGAPRSAREGVPRLDRARRQWRQDRQQGDHRRSARRCARSARGSSATTASRITGSTTPWRRRRRRCAACSTASGRRHARSALADRDAMQAMVTGRGRQFRARAVGLALLRREAAQAAVRSSMRRRSSRISSSTHIIEAAFYTAYRLFGLSFERRKDVPTWHPDVQAWEVRAADGSHRGLFFGDYFARSSKQGGAWMTTLRDQEKLSRRHPAAGRQCDELQQGRRQRSRRCSASTTRARCSTSSATRCMRFSPTSPIRWFRAPAC